MELTETIKQFNWIDILIIGVLFRICYIGIKQGFVVEFFKLLGIIFSVYFTLNYYSALGGFLSVMTPIAESNCYMFSYVAIFLVIVAMFMLMRQGILLVIKIEAVDVLARWGGLVLGALRGLLTVSLICVFFLIANNEYLRGSTKQSYLGSRVVYIAPNAYKSVFEGLTARFNANSKANRVLFDALEGK